MLKGSCLCAAVSYEIAGAIFNPRFCHCASCRKFSGAAYAAWGVVKTEDFRTNADESRITKFDSGGGLRVFCKACGSPLWYEPAQLPAFRGVPLGTLDDGEVPAPAMHVWTQSKVPWLSISDGLPQYAIHP